MDSTAVSDSLAVLGPLRDFLVAVLPFLSAENVDKLAAWATSFVLGIPVLAGVFASGWAARALALAVPFLKRFAVPLERFSWVINPALAFLFAMLIFKNPMAALGAGVLWGSVKAAAKKNSAEGKEEIRRIYASLAALLLPLTFAFGGGALYDRFDEQTRAYGEARIGMTVPKLGDHVKFEVGAIGQLEADPQYRAGVLLVF